MGKFSPIGWTDHTFNPWIGCQKVSPGCQFCYAENETFVRRERSRGHELWGPEGVRYRTSDDYWKEPLRWNDKDFWACRRCTWRGLVDPSIGLACPECGGDIAPTRQRVFCASLSDIFEDGKQLDRWRVDLINLIDRTPNLIWMLLTKRINNADIMLPYDWLDGGWPENVWIGTSVENQQMADERMPKLMKLPAKVRFVSAEPLLGPIDLVYPGEEVPNWIIVGGESGRKCRPMNIEWAKWLLDQSRAVDPPIPFFMKQLGGHPDKRDNIEEMRADLRVRELPKA